MSQQRCQSIFILIWLGSGLAPAQRPLWKGKDNMRFAIVGAAEERPQQDPPIDIQKARDAAKHIGVALAKRGHGLVVYDAKYIEADVVAAYIAAGPRMPERGVPIMVRQSPAPSNVRFAEEQTGPAMFDRVFDPSAQWEVSFYRSLANADGVVLIGGGNTTLIAGQVAIGARIPVLPLLRSGGAAATVWQTISPGVDLPVGPETARMADEPSESAAERWVDVLESQSKRRYAVESGPIVRHAVIASILFVMALLCAFGGQLILGTPSKAWPIAMLFLGTLFAGVAGAAVRMVFERRYGSGPLVPPSMAVTIALGLMAGALAGMLYIVAQPGEINVTPDTAGLRLVSLVLVVASVGGLTAEAIFRKLLGIDVLHTGGLSVTSERTGK